MLNNNWSGGVGFMTQSRRFNNNFGMAIKNFKDDISDYGCKYKKWYLNNYKEDEIKININNNEENQSYEIIFNLPNKSRIKKTN